MQPPDKNGPDHKDLHESPQPPPPIPASLVSKWQDLIDSLAQLLNMKAIIITSVTLTDLKILATNQEPDSPFKIGTQHSYVGHYCEDVLQKKTLLFIDNAIQDARWRQSPEAQAGLISYLGYPLLWPDNTLFGSLCLFGTEANQIKPNHRNFVQHIHELIESQLAAHYQTWQIQHNAQVLFETMFESTPDAICIINLNAEIQQCNRAFWELYGADSQSPLIGFSALDLLPNEERSRALDHLRSLPELGTLRNSFYNFVNKDGLHIPVEVSTSITRDTDGQPVSVIVILQDITERKKAEQALAEQEALLGSIFRAAPIGIGLLSNRVFIHVNDQICRMTGYEREELLNQNARKLYTSDHEYERVGREKYGQIKKRGTGTVETRWQHKNGKIIDILLSSSPLDPEDWAVGVTFTALDITERKSYQSNLRSLTQQLSIAEERERRRVAVGVHDDIGQKLVLAKLDLQSLKQSLPVHQTMIETTLDRVCDLIDVTMQEARSLAFDLSNPVLYEVGFDAAVESWLSRQIKEIPGLEYSFTTRKERTRLDQQAQVMLFQVVREVLTNVIKHAQASKVEVTIENDPESLTVIIADNGIGFDLAVLDWDVGGKRGLGLFNVRERLEYLGGTMAIASEPGQGTKVTLTAPARNNLTD